MSKLLLTFSCIFFFGLSMAQPPAMELKQNGFDAVTVSFPSTPAEKLIELTQNWAFEFNRKESGFDVTNVTTNTITVTANKKNAFFYRERGEAFDHDIRYEMQLAFNNNNYTLNFVVTEIYFNGKRIEYTIPDYFTANGRLKEGYEEIERSLEATVNNIVKSHYNYIMNFR